jgi:F-type H+-transporting ATPase subunit delta
MAELVTVARPYAEAVFRAALEKKELGSVAESLALVSAVARDATMRSLLTNPKVSVAQKKELFFAVVGEKAGELVRNVVSLLLENHREALLPDIAVLFEELKRESERVVHAKITSAQPLSDQQRSDIIGALERQYDRKFEAELDVDAELLGGARVQVGDQVIHASVRDALADMAAALAR